jgi:two-component system response regulator NreC
LTAKSEAEIKSVLIVDSHPLVREGLRNSLLSCGGFEVVAEAEDADTALFAGQKHNHDIMLICAMLPGANIFESVAEHKKEFPDAKIAVCYVPEDPIFLQEFVASGADALVGQDANSSEYLAAALSIVAGGFYISRNLVHCLLLDRRAPRDHKNAYNLTRRESEVLRLLARGLCNKEIANMLKLSVRTVEAHRFSIRTKTGSSALSDLLKIARGMGLTPVNSSTPPKVTQKNIEDEWPLEPVGGRAATATR